MKDLWIEFNYTRYVMFINDFLENQYNCFQLPIQCLPSYCLRDLGPVEKEKKDGKNDEKKEEENPRIKVINGRKYLCRCFILLFQKFWCHAKKFPTWIFVPHYTDSDFQRRPLATPQNSRNVKMAQTFCWRWKIISNIQRAQHLFQSTMKKEFFKAMISGISGTMNS